MSINVVLIASKWKIPLASRNSPGLSDKLIRAQLRSSPTVPTSSPGLFILFHTSPSWIGIMAPSASSKKSRPLLIPHKRALLPLQTKSRKVYKVLNPSAIPAETSIKQSYEEETQERNKPASSSEHNKSAVEDEDYELQPPHFEVSFAMPPQPFLDPPTWEAMLKHGRERLASQSIKDESGLGADREGESAERVRQRVERETEYGSMAIRGRSSVRGRGKRGRGRGNVYWGGRH